MKENFLFLKSDYYNQIRKLGGTWNDYKVRPVFVAFPSTENPKIYWAVPVGNFKHRTTRQKQRIRSYIYSNPNKIESSFYHIGKTDKQSIFFISDVIPITEEYIERSYNVGTGMNRGPYVIKNPNLIRAISNKIGNILEYEKRYYKRYTKPYFRQNIIGLYNFLNK